MPGDTNAESIALQHRIFCRLTTVERLRMALEMSESLRNVALAGLRSRRPELNQKQLDSELMRVLYGAVSQP